MLRIEKRTVFFYLAITFLTIILYFLSFDTAFYVSFSIIVVLLFMIKTKLNVSHPCIWLYPIFMLYQIAYPSLKLMGIDVYSVTPLNSDYNIINWLCLVFFGILLSNIKVVNYQKIDSFVAAKKKNILIILIVTMMLSIAGSIYISSKGYTTKYDIGHSNDFLISFSQIIMNLVSLVSVYFCLSDECRKKERIIVFLASSIILFFCVGVTGERDLIISHLVMFFIYYCIKNKPKTKTIITVATLMLLFVSVSSSLKMFLADRTTNVADNNQTIIEKLLTSDFQSAGFNFNYLLNNKNAWGYRYGKTLIYDALSVIRNVIDFGDLNSTKWYQETFWAKRRTGLGFTYLGEGYINFGTIGALVWVFILYYITKKLYYNSNKNIFYFVVYLSFCPLCMYIMRADLANLTSPFIKYTLLGTAILYMFGYNKRTNKNQEINTHDV